MTSVAGSVLCDKNMLEVLILIVNVVLLCILAIMARQLFRHLKQSTPPKYTSTLGVDVDLPSVSVCIPARNEAHALMDCLQKVIASDYQKLEIIVLDDVSGDNTSALIKSFASEGVRFVQGKPLDTGWLGKNHALQGLLEEASGSYILYMDVDTRLEPHAVEHMVRYALSQRASMVSVLPRREDGWRASIILSPLRYFWELIFNRFQRPSTASNAWLIRREVLQSRFDGFNAYKTAVQPESQIAAELAKSNEYRFLIGSKYFGVGFEKKWRSQLITSVRLLYPIIGERISLTLLAALYLIFFLVPFVTLCVLLPLGLVSVPAIVSSSLVGVGFMALYAIYTHRVWRHGWFVGALLWPVIIIQEIILIFASLLQYKRRTVKWKGRLIRPEAQS